MSRKGTKAALTPTAFREIFQQVEQKDRSVAAVMQLAYVLGLRTKEAVEAYKSLATWKKALENGHTSVRVVFGTKGGRPRQTVILDREALQYAIAYAECEQAGRSGRLIDKPTIYQAIDRYRYVVRRAGLVGKLAPHSMRYHFASNPGHIIKHRVLVSGKRWHWYQWIWGMAMGGDVISGRRITRVLRANNKMYWHILDKMICPSEHEQLIGSHHFLAGQYLTPAKRYVSD